MSGNSAFWLANPSTGFYNGEVQQSGRFFGSTGYLDHEFSTPTSQKKMIFAVWVKPSEFGSTQHIMGAGPNVTNYFLFCFSASGFYNSTDSFKFGIVSSNVNRLYRVTDRLFRDPSAWIHVCVAIDTTQATASDRVQLFFNGKRYTGGFSLSNTPSQDYDVPIVNTAIYHQIGLLYTGGNYGYNDGYLADFYFLDGQSIYSDTSATINSTFLADADTLGTFCEQKNGVAIPKAYTGATSTYGNNGFRLEFKNNTAGGSSPSTSSLGADTSGKTNHFNDYSGTSTWQGNNFDSPENNFCVWNPLRKGANVTVSKGALSGVTSATVAQSVAGTFGVSSGKWYWEVRNEGGSLGYIGIVDETHDMGTYIGSSSTGSGYAYNTAGQKVGPTSGTAVSYGATFAAGDIIGIALNMDDGEITFYKANSSQGAAFTGLTGNWFPAVSGNGVSGKGGIANFGTDSSFAGNETRQNNSDGNGNGDFYYSPPSGFLALCTANLPDVAIGPDSATNTDDHFNTFLYTGTGATNRNLASNNFTPDWVWLKSRSQTDNHVVIDVLRKNGSNFPNLHPNLTDVEANDTHPKRITNGIQVSGGLYDNSGVNFVVWNWKAGGDPDDVTGNFIKDGAAFTPTQGNIDANSISVNTTAGFSIVEFTSTVTSSSSESDAPHTVAHGLGVEPRWVIIKDRDGGSYPHWNVWHPGYQPDQTYLNYQLFLELSNAANNQGWTRADTGMTTNLFCLPVYQYTESGKDYIAYVFNEVEGFSKFGHYIGNNSTDGPFVYLGFQPQFLIIKRANDAGLWQLLDNKRNPFNPTDIYIYNPGSGTEVDGSGLSPAIIVDFLSNGFKIRTTEAVYNSSGGTFVYMAFAEEPFKFSNGK